MFIDVHAHALSPDLVRRVADTPGFWLPLESTGRDRYRIAGGPELDPMLYDVRARLDLMKQRDVMLQLVSPSPSIISNGDKVIGFDEARAVNHSTAWLVSNGEGRLAGLAVPVLGEPARAADELRRAIEHHGFVGVVLSTGAGTRPLDDPVFAELIATIEALDLLVFMHPTTSALGMTQTEYTLRTLVAWPTETTIAVTRLIFAGVFERHPALKVVLAHGGGTLPMLAGRLDLGWSAPRYEANAACRANITRAPSSYLRGLYYDTVVADAAVLDFIVATYGADHLLFGTDFPYEIGDAEGSLAFPALRRLPEADRRTVMSANAIELLGRHAPSTLRAR